jgi:hypothetical protein
MEMLAYGEDALTLWALRDKLLSILQFLHDSTSATECQIIFRPSFGRKGGLRSPQFGEFDFIILSKKLLYLGESKWDRSSEKIEEGILTLRPEQQLRHDIFKFYITEWAFGCYTNQDWAIFKTESIPKLQVLGIEKAIAPAGSLLASNLQTVLRVIRNHYTSLPEVKNILLYLHSGSAKRPLFQRAGKDFDVIPVDYSEYTFDYFIKFSV